MSSEIQSNDLAKAIDSLNTKYGDKTVTHAKTYSFRFKILKLPNGRDKRYFAPASHPFIKRPI